MVGQGASQGTGKTGSPFGGGGSGGTLTQSTGTQIRGGGAGADGAIIIEIYG